MHPNESFFQDDCVQGVVRQFVRHLVCQAGFSACDREDLEQDLRLHLLRRLGAFDPQVAPPCVFATVVVARRAANILRDRRAAGRAAGRILSLATPVEGEAGPVELAETVGEDETPARRLGGAPDAAEQSRLAADLDSVLRRLPGELRRLAELLQSGSLSRAAREMRVPRSTLQYRAARLRRVFESAGLKEYLGRGSSSGRRPG